MFSSFEIILGHVCDMLQTFVGQLFDLRLLFVGQCRNDFGSGMPLSSATMSCTTFPSKHSAPLPSIASKTTWSVLLLSQSAAAARDPMRWLLKKLASSGSEAMAHLALEWLGQHRNDPSRLLVDTDESNAHNEVDATFSCRACAKCAMGSRDG